MPKHISVISCLFYRLLDKERKSKNVWEYVEMSTTSGEELHNMALFLPWLFVF